MLTAVGDDLGRGSLGVPARPDMGRLPPDDQIAVLHFNLHRLAISQSGDPSNIHGHPDGEVLPPFSDDTVRHNERSIQGISWHIPTPAATMPKAMRMTVASGGGNWHI